MSENEKIKSDLVESKIGCAPPLNSPDECSAPKTSDTRKMVKAELMGSHTHHTAVGTKVHIWKRCNKYIGRGRFEKQAFGEALGLDSNEREAESKLRQLMTDIENGSFVRASDQKKQPLNSKRIPKLTLRQLFNKFIEEKKKTKGFLTSRNYLNRLSPILDFAEKRSSIRVWKLASNIDRNFVLDCRKFLINLTVTSNGSAGAELKPMSIRQVSNCLETMRNALKWALRADVRLLPLEFVNPVVQDLIPKSPTKNPLRKPKIPLEKRIVLLQKMTDRQFLLLSILFVLPLRFEDISGALISDINFESSEMSFGTRFDGSDFNKGRVEVRMPLPPELVEVFKLCKGERQEGPLFLSSKGLKISRNTKNSIASRDELEQRFHKQLGNTCRDQVHCEQDRKKIFREMLKELGGVSSSYVGKQIRAIIGRDGSTRPYDLRGSITQEMHESDMRLLELKYLTLHSVNDIINEYSGLQPEHEIKKYFEKIRPLLEVIRQRTDQLKENKENLVSFKKNEYKE